MTVKAHIARNSLSGAIVAVGAILATGCGSQSATSAAPPTASTSSVPAASTQASTPAGGQSGTATSKASSQPSATHDSAAPVGKPACGTANLRISLGAGGGAAGTDFTVIDFTNSGSAPCTLYGFPGVSLANSSGAQIGAAATRNPSRPTTLVTLAPGAKANADFGVANAGNYPAQDCKPTPAAHLKVFPPNQTQPIVEPFSTTACAVSSAHQLSVTAVAAGQGQTVP